MRIIPDDTAVSTLTGGTVASKELSPVHASEVKQWVKNRLFPKCPLLNGDTYDTLFLHDKLADFLDLTDIERLEHKGDMRRLTLRQVEQLRHNAKTAVQKKIKGESGTQGMFDLMLWHALGIANYALEISTYSCGNKLPGSTGERNWTRP